LSPTPPPDIALSEDVTIHADEYQDALGRIVPELKTGIDAARNGDLNAALRAFDALHVYPGIEVQAIEEIKRQRAFTLARMLEQRVTKNSDLASAETWLNTEFEGLEPVAPARKKLERLVYPTLAQAYRARALKKMSALKDVEAKASSSDDYVAAYSDMTKAEQLDPITPLPALYWNNLCWWGSIAGRAKDLLKAGERAVELAPGDAGFRDTRGLSRALVGNLSGARADFAFFVGDSDAQKNFPGAINERKGWIEQLTRKVNPITKATLEKLRNE
jgi:hypothetical protein